MKTYIKKAIYNYRANHPEKYRDYQRNLMNERNYWKAFYNIEKEMKVFRKILI